MRTKFLFPASLFSLTLLFILYVTPADACFGEDNSYIRYTCLGNGQFLVTVKVSEAELNPQFTTFCQITVTPEQSAASAFAYHLNRMENLVPDPSSYTEIAVDMNTGYVFSRILNLGVYQQWCKFKIEYNGPSGFTMDLTIDRCQVPCSNQKLTIVGEGMIHEVEVADIQLTQPETPIVVDPEPLVINTEAPMQDQGEAADPDYFEIEMVDPFKEAESVFSPEQGSSVKDFEAYLAKMAEEDEKEAMMTEIFILLTEIENEASTLPQEENKAIPYAGKGLNVNMQLYPNPSSGNINLEIAGANDKTYSLQIIDISGKRVFETAGVGASYLIERNSLPAGMYKVMLTGDAGGFYSGTFILQ